MWLRWLRQLLALCVRGRGGRPGPDSAQPAGRRARPWAVGRPWRLPRGARASSRRAQARVARGDGLSIEPGRFLGIWMDTYGPAPDANATLNLVWTARIVAGDPVAADDVSELRWFAAGEIPPPDELAFDLLPSVFRAGSRRERRLPLRRRQHAARQRPRGRRSAGSSRPTEVGTDCSRRYLRVLRGASERARVRRLPGSPAALPPPPARPPDPRPSRTFL